jgi:cytochrome P450
MSARTTGNRAEVPDNIAALDLADRKSYLVHDMDKYWRRLRDDHPLHWHPAHGDRPGFWVVSRHADVMALYRDNQRLTSEKGNVLTSW